MLLKSRVGTVIARRGGVAEGKELASSLLADSREEGEALLLNIRVGSL